MRLLLTTDCVGGVFDYTASLAHRLDRDGHAVLVAIIGSPSDAQLALLPATVEVAAKEYRLEWMAGAESDLDAAAEWLRELAEEWAADVIHFNQMAYPGLVRFASPAVVVVHSDVRSWFSEVEGEDRPAGWEAYSQWVRRGLDAATTVVACTRYQAGLTARHFGARVDHVIPNGSDLPVTGPAQTECKEPILVTAGRGWDRAKGLAILDQALERLGSRAPETHHFGSLRAPGGDVLSVERICAHGTRPAGEVHDWMNRVAAYVAPSLYEPFGLAPLEAAFRRCALVLSDIGSFRELWDGCAEFFRPGDPESLAAAISRVMSDEDRRLTLATRARERASERYTADRMTDRYLALYRTLVRGGRVSSTAHPRRVPVAAQPTHLTP